MNETGWLIEIEARGVPLYWAGAFHTSDANEAIRFARKEDAEKVIDWFARPSQSFKATEHVWLNGASVPA